MVHSQGNMCKEKTKESEENRELSKCSPNRPFVSSVEVCYCVQKLILVIRNTCSFLKTQIQVQSFLTHFPLGFDTCFAGVKSL